MGLKVNLQSSYEQSCSTLNSQCYIIYQDSALKISWFWRRRLLSVSLHMGMVAILINVQIFNPLLTLVLLNKLRYHAHFQFLAYQIT